MCCIASARNSCQQMLRLDKGKMAGWSLIFKKSNLLYECQPSGFVDRALTQTVLLCFSRPVIHLTDTVAM